MVYVVGAVFGGIALPRFENKWQTDAGFRMVELSVSSAQAYLSAAASGMMALTGIVFALAFVMVHFSAIAYSPRLVLWFARDRMLFHELGAFSATFIFALATLALVDRNRNGMVPPFSLGIVGILIVVSMLLFARLMQRLNDLQITNVLHLIGDQGRWRQREPLVGSTGERYLREARAYKGPLPATLGFLRANTALICAFAASRRDRTRRPRRAARRSIGPFDCAQTGRLGQGRRSSC
jgi:hypothetical protein